MNNFLSLVSNFDNDKIYLLLFYIKNETRMKQCKINCSEFLADYRIIIFVFSNCIIISYNIVMLMVRFKYDV